MLITIMHMKGCFHLATQTLADLPVGQAAEITGIRAEEADRRHLAELGLTEGAEICCRLRAPGGSPAAFSVHGITLALRVEICRSITVKLLRPVRTILLAGNPNVGKSSVFNALTGLRQHTGNWCGKTVSGAEGIMHLNGESVRLIDTPGTYSVNSETAEEAVTGQIIRSEPHDCILCICDAAAPVRGIALLLEIMETDPAAVLCLNMMDTARKKHIEINMQGLSEKLGVPVIGISARERASLRAVGQAAESVMQKSPPCRTHRSHRELLEEAAALTQEFFRIPQYPHRGTERADRILTCRWVRLPLMLLLLTAVFWLTMVGVNAPSELLSRGFSALCSFLLDQSQQLGIPQWLSGALIDGVLRGTGWVIAVMLPPMAVFFPLFTVLEDTGLLPRIAFNMDRCCARCKACGKQALTMTMGFGCNAVGVTGCRIIEGKKERLIAVLTNSFVPCNGRFPALLAVVTIFFAGSSPQKSLYAALLMTLLIALSIAVSFGISALLGRTVLRGNPGSCILELPPYRRPQIGKILVRSLLDRTILVLCRAVAVAAPVSLLIWILANLHIGNRSLLRGIAAFLQPAGNFIGLDGELLLAFILGLPANEIILPAALTAYLGAGTLTDYGSLESLHMLLLASGWTKLTAACFLVFTLFHAPCATTLLTIRKETGSLRATLAAWLLPLLTGIILCSILHAAAVLI